MAELLDGFVPIPRSELKAMDDMSPLQVKLYCWMWRQANFRDRDRLERGQFVATIAEMQEAMSHHEGWKKVKPSPDQIRTAYGALCGDRSNPARITVRRTTRGMVITVLNYNAFYIDALDASHTVPREANAACPGATPHDTEQIEQQEKKQPAGDVDFDKCFDWFWNLYPKRGDKKRTRERLLKSCKTRKQWFQLGRALNAYMDAVEEERAGGFDRQWQLSEVWANRWQGYIPDDCDELWKEREAEDAAAGRRDTVEDQGRGDSE